MKTRKFKNGMSSLKMPLPVIFIDYDIYYTTCYSTFYLEAFVESSYSQSS